jgi:uncharacterized membrane protein
MTTAVSTATPGRLSADAKLRIAIGVLSVIGIGIGAYLTYTHYAKLNVLCLSSGGCETVQHSRWSKLDGIPVATLGLAGYIGILISVFIRGELGRALGFALALVGFLFSMYLTYREAFTIHAYCQWCLGSAALLTVLAILTTIRMLRTEPGDPAAPASKGKSFDRAERRRQMAARR